MKSITPCRYPTMRRSRTLPGGALALRWLALVALTCVVGVGCADVSSGGRTGDDSPVDEADESGGRDVSEEADDDETPVEDDAQPGESEQDTDDESAADDDGTAGMDAHRPIPDQSCDGVDDDRDGRVDEDFESPERCAVGEGECRREGRLICENARIVCDARSGSPTADVCDQRDNDCDGRVDEGNRGTITLHDTRTPVDEFSPRCGRVQPRSPLMYTAVDCSVAEADCLQTVTWGSSTVVWDAEPGVYYPNAYCCEVNVAQCFGESWQCQVGDEVHPCDCTLATADPIIVEACTDVEFVACQ